MRKVFLALILVLAPVAGMAAGGAVHLDKAHVDLGNRDSLQRGAKNFINYCLSCHSASYMRYNRMGADLGISDDQLRSNLMFAAEKVGETMDIAMRQPDAKTWFGTVAPDLTVVARSRGADWLYTYLRSFYIDETRPFGVNNTVFPDVAMPHVLWELQGLQKAVYKEQADGDGHGHKVFDRFEIMRQGSLQPREYDVVVRDLVNFMVYMGEPAKMHRQRVGMYVLLFLAVFFVVAYLLKKEYWKDVH